MKTIIAWTIEALVAITLAAPAVLHLPPGAMSLAVWLAWVFAAMNWIAGVVYLHQIGSYVHYAEWVENTPTVGLRSSFARAAARSALVRVIDRLDRMAKRTCWDGFLTICGRLLVLGMVLSAIWGGRLALGTAIGLGWVFAYAFSVVKPTERTRAEAAMRKLDQFEATRPAVAA